MTDFIWISSNGDEIEPDEDDNEYPMFYVGDEVLLFSPYTEEMLVKEDGFSPEKFEVLEVRYDEEDAIYRYRLDKGLPHKWYSEEWLSLPLVTDLVKDNIPASKKDIERGLDEQLKELEIDRLLDILQNGTNQEKEQAEKALEKMVEGR